MKTPSTHPKSNAAMKIARKSRPSILATSAVALLGLGLFVGPAKAQQIWDVNGVVAGGAGNGNWDLVTPNWTVDPAGILPPAVWNQGQDASFNFAGGGTVTVTGAVQVNDINFGTNGYTVTGGALTLAGGSPFIDVSAGITGTISAPLTGANSVTINGFGGTGTIVFAGNGTNNYTGLTTVSGGTLQLNNGAVNVAIPGNLTIGDSAGAAGSAVVQLLQNTEIANSSAVLINSDGLFNLNGFTETVGSVAGGAGSQIALGAGALSTGDASNTAFAGVISGSGTVTKNGAGTWTLTGANTYTGQTNVQGGLLIVGNNAALGTAATGTTVIAGASAQLANGINTGAEAFVLNGAGVNPATGALAVAPGGTATVGGPITIATNSTITANGGTLTLTGPINKNGTTLTFGTATSGGGTANVNGVISGAAANSDLIVESMTVNLNAANTYNGPTFIRSTGAVGTGILNANVAGALPNPVFGAPARSALTMDDSTSQGGSVLNLNNGVGQVVASLTSPNSVIGQSSQINLNGNTLTIGTAAGTTTFFGRIGTNGPVDLGGIIKDGASTQIFAGNTENYIGNTLVQAGHLQIGNGVSGNLNGASAVTVNPLAFLDLNLANGATFQNAVLNNGTVQGINTVGNIQTVSGVITGIGNFLQNAGGTTILANKNTYQGGTSITAASTVQIGTGALAGSAGTGLISVSGGSTLALVNADGNVLSNNISNVVGTTGTVASTTATSITLSGNLTDGGGGTLAVTQSGTGNLILTGANTYTGATTVTNGELQAGSNTALGGTATGTTVSGTGTLRILNGVTIGAEPLSISGTGTANKGALAGSLGGVAAYTGAITVAANASINSAGGTLTLSGGIVKNGTTLTLTGGGLGGTINLNAVGISGAAANSDLIVDGVTVNENIANSYNGPTFLVNGATLNANVVNALPTLNGRSAVSIDASGSGNSKLVLGAAQSVASLAGTSTTSSINLNTFNLTIGAAAGTTSFAGTISGSGGLVKDTAGSVQILAGANTYTGTTLVSGGTLQAGSTSAFGINSAVTVNAASTLDLGGFNNTIGSLAGAAGAIVQNSTATPATLTTGTDNTSTAFAGVIQNGAGGILSLTKNGLGTQTLSGANTYTGATTVNNGTLQVGNGATGSIAGASAVTVNNNAILGVNLLGGSTFANAVTVNAGGLVNANNAAGTQTFSGIITGGGALTQSGAGTTLLTAANTYTGATTVTAGVLQVGNGAIGSLSGLSAVTVSPAAFLDVNLVNGGTFANSVLNNGGVRSINGAGTTQTFSGVISGAGNFAQNAGGTGILANNNSYAGGTAITAASTVQIGTVALAGSAGTGLISVSGGSTLALVNVSGNVLSNNISNVVGGTGTVNSTAAGTVNLAGNLTDGGGGTLAVIQNGTGNLIVSGANSYTGATTVNAGELQVGSNTALGGTGTGTTVNNGGTLRLLNGVSVGAEALSLNGFGGTDNSGALAGALGGTASYAGAITLAGNASINATNGTLNLTGGINKNGNFLTLTGGIINISVLGISGAADLVVDGGIVNENVANSYVGPTWITNGGTLNANVANALPTAGGRSAVNFDPTVAIPGSPAAFPSTGNSRLVLGAAQSAASLAGTNTTSLINLNTFTLTIGAAAGTTSFAGAISGSGGITKDTAGSTQILAGINTYTGATNVTGGNLQAGSLQAFGLNSAVTVGGGAILDLAGFNNSIGSLAGAGTVQNSTGTAAFLTTGTDNTSTLFSGIIQNGAGAVLGLTKVGTGTQTLTGANTYTGATTVNGGILQVGNGVTGSLAAASPVTVNNGGTLGINLANLGTFGNNVLINAGGLVSGNNGAASTQTLSGILSGAGALNQNGLGLTILTGASTYTGPTTVLLGTLQVGNGVTGSINPSSLVTVNTGAALNIFLANGGVFGNVVNDNGTVNGLAAAGTTNIISGAIGGLGVFNQTGAGTSILTGANTYSGATNVNAGTLQVGNGVTGSINPGSPVTVLAGATLAINLANDGVFANTVADGGTVNFLVVAPNTNNVTGVISGVGVVNQNGTGTTNVSGANTYSGLTTLNAGVIEVRNNAALGSTLAGTVVNTGAALRLATGITVGAEALTLNGNGTGGANALGALTQVAGGTSTYGGPITIASNSTINSNGGTMTLTGTINKTSVNLTLAGGGIINVNGAIVITGAAAGFNDDLIVNGTTANLNAANSYLGPTIIRSSVVAGDGVLNANVANALPTVNGRTTVTMDDSGVGGSILNLAASQSIASLVGAASSRVTLNANTLTVGFGSGLNTNGTANATFAGVMSGTGGITKDDTSTQILSGLNTYTGQTRVTGGILRAGSTQAFGVNSATLVGTGAVLDLAGNSNSIGSLSDIGGVGGIVRSTVGAATLTTGGNNTSTAFAGIIQNGVGPLTFRKVGSGTQSLSGQNTYTGDTFLDEGQLNANTAPGATTNTAFGTGVLHIADGTTLGSTVANETVSNNVLVNGSFSVQPLGNQGNRLNLSGNVNLGVTGPTITNTTALGQVDLLGVVSGSSGVTFAANAGLGGFFFGDSNNVANPANALANTYAGLTTIAANAGLVLTKSDGVIALPGSAVIDAGGVLALFANNQIIDSATITVNSTGNSALGTAFGGFFLNGKNEAINQIFGTGTVQLDSTPTGGVVGGTLTVNGGAFSGVIFDSNRGGRLVKNSSGTLLLTGASTYTGNTTINAGTLILDGSLRSTILVNANGTLTGFGRTSGGVVNSGNFKPGRSPGTFTIGGNFTQTSGGTLTIEIAGKKVPDHDLVAVGGQANLDGNLRLVNLNGTKLKVGDRITFITAAGGVNGEFSDITNPFGPTGTIVRNEVLYLSNSVVLEAVQGSFAEFANAEGLTPNQKSVAKALDRIAFNSRQVKLISFLDRQLLGELPHQFDLIAAEELQSIYTIGISQANVQSANLSRRMDDIRAGTAGFSASGLSVSGLTPQYSGNYLMPNNGLAGPEGKFSKEIRPPAEVNRLGVFVTGSGEFSSTGTTYNASGYNLASGGFTLGVDYKVSENFAIGINAGYSRSSADLYNNGNVAVDGAKLGVYATYFTGGFYVDAAVQGGYNGYDTRRSALQGSASGNTTGAEINALVSTGYDWKSGGLTVGPIASFQYTNVGFDEFTEHGSLAPLKYGSQSGESMRTALGAKASYEFQFGSVIVKPEVRASWQHEFGDSAFGITSQFAKAGSDFTVHGAEIGDDSLLLGAGFAILWNERTSTYVYYDGEIGRSNYEANNISGGVRLEF